VRIASSPPGTFLSGFPQPAAATFSGSEGTAQLALSYLRWEASPEMKRFFVLISMAAISIAAIPARAAEATFERNLSMTGRVDLTIENGAGGVHLTSGPAGQVHVFARVKSSWGGDDSKVEEIAAHPPIEQTGSIVRIGQHENLRNISIDYEIEAPADAFLRVSTGSGGIDDGGVGADAKLMTGSGGIHATGLQGGFSVGTGSGSIYAEQVGRGDVEAKTGSGSIELKNLSGGLHAQTGSGGVKVTGTPNAAWRIQTGSGGVELWTGNAGCDLDASTGSGGIHTDREIASQGSIGHHHATGKIAGGGPVLYIRTGSGGIHIH
jgi:Putative adhesin